jgi:hypothetical protein
MMPAPRKSRLYDTAKDSATPTLNDVPVSVDFPRLLVDLSLSRRTGNRLLAAGLLPPPDLMVGNKRIWLRSTIETWLRSKPRLPGRGGKGGLK